MKRRRVPKTCRHCGRDANDRGRGLCYRCYSTPAILALYPPMARRCSGEGDGIYDVVQERMPGDAPCRCLYCGRYACSRWLSLCQACKLWYERRAVGMPQERSIESWKR